jgi:hypothetical protein
VTDSYVRFSAKCPRCGLEAEWTHTYPAGLSGNGVLRIVCRDCGDSDPVAVLTDAITEGAG